MMKYYGKTPLYDLLGPDGSAPDTYEVMANIIDHEESKDFLNDIKDELDDTIGNTLDLIECDFEVTSTSRDGTCGEFSILIQTNRELTEDEITAVNNCIKELSDNCYWSGCLSKLELRKI